MRRRFMVWLSLVFVVGASVHAEPIPIQSFFDGLRVQQVAISPDGRYLSSIVKIGDKTAVVVADRSKPDELKPVVANDSKDRTNPRWCGWANRTRLLCGFYGVTASGGKFYPYSRLVAVNADGSDLKVLEQTTKSGQMLVTEVSPQYQDQIIDWTPEDPYTVLMQLRDPQSGYPTVVAVDVYSGKRKTVEYAHPPITVFRTDGHGNIRLGAGARDGEAFYFAKLAGESTWRQLAKVEIYAHGEDVFRPIAVQANSNLAYAFKSHGDRQALWQIDLADKEQPKLVFEHPDVDVSGTFFTADKRLLGVSYTTDQQGVYYTDEKARAFARAINAALPGTLNGIVDITPDERFFIVSASSDVASRTFYLLDASSNQLQLQAIGSTYPQLGDKKLSTMRAITYPATDGTTIPGYLTVPAGMSEQNLPLIVMPHGGPYARDVWGFDAIVQLLASRGYAVLQMNFRGSKGFGDKWYWSAHQDWGGLTYSDITDATRWAIKQGIADPKRVCIVGASFGGYAALLGATRNSDLYRCAVSISGVSDLPELIEDQDFFGAARSAREQVGTDSAKLKADSPRRHVEKVNIPVLMIHGDHDYTVEFDQTQLMADALKSAGKQYKVVRVRDADHYFSEDSDARTLYTELETFLNAHLNSEMDSASK